MYDRFLRLPAVTASYGKSRSTIYDEVARGLIPPPIPLGGRSIGWSEREIDAVIRARIAGRSDNEIRTLVADLVARRREVA